jgi:hypothetical protein
MLTNSSGFDGALEQVALTNIMIQIWPLIEKIFTKHANEENIIQVNSPFLDLLSLGALSTNFNHHHVCWIQIGNSRINEFHVSIFDALLQSCWTLFRIGHVEMFH